MFQSTPISPLMSEAGLLPAHILLGFRQRLYALRTLSLPDPIPTKDILPITLWTGDGNAQPEDQPEHDSAWATTQRIKTFGQHLARRVSVGFSIDPAEGTEPILVMPLKVFPGRVFVEERNRAFQVAKQGLANAILWCDRSKLDYGGTGAAVVWKESGQDRGWHEQKVTLGRNKEVLDAEIPPRWEC